MEQERRRGQKKSGAVGDTDEGADIEALLGIAMGCMGMSMDDFCRCAPSEFWQAWQAWSDCEARKERGAWERMRMECVCMLQPWAKKRLTARDVMVFAWEKTEDRAHGDDGAHGDGGVETPPHVRAKLGREEMLERYEEAKRKRGLR